MTAILASLGCLFALFGVLLIVDDGSVPIGAVLLVLSVIAFVVWWRMWEKR
jgi:hypothetical protein